MVIAPAIMTAAIAMSRSHAELLEFEVPWPVFGRLVTFVVPAYAFVGLTAPLPGTLVGCAPDGAVPVATGVAPV